eukprot:scaffold12211_cov116-Isochrysis_galbana.AAC.8
MCLASAHSLLAPVAARVKTTGHAYHYAGRSELQKNHAGNTAEGRYRALVVPVAPSSEAYPSACVIHFRVLGCKFRAHLACALQPFVRQATAGVFGLFSASHSASHSVGLAGLARHSSTNPALRVGINASCTYALAALESGSGSATVDGKKSLHCRKAASAEAEA